MAADYRELLVWQKALDLCDLVYTATEKFPRDEIFGLTQQVRRAAVSVPSNIAEGQGRLTKGEFCHLLGVARGSLFEAETQLMIAQRRGYLSQEGWLAIAPISAEIARMLNGLIASLQRSDS